MNWREETIEYIKDNLNLIDSNNFTDLYDEVARDARGNITPLLLEADINPLLYMDAVPAGYLPEQRDVKSIIIPGNIKSIGDYAFKGCSNLTSIIIPDSVTSIGDRAFAFCESLTDINIPNSVKNIGKYAFFNCSNLTNVTIPDNIKSISADMFGFCESLTSINIPNSVKSIGRGVFYKCGLLKTINYNGSKEQWNSINKGPKWKYNSSLKIIRCTDGDIKL